MVSPLYMSCVRNSLCFMRGLGMPRLRNSAAFTSMNSSFAFLFLDAREKKHLYYESVCILVWNLELTVLRASTNIQILSSLSRVVILGVNSNFIRWNNYSSNTSKDELTGLRLLETDLTNNSARVSKEVMWPNQLNRTSTKHSINYLQSKHFSAHKFSDSRLTYFSFGHIWNS